MNIHDILKKSKEEELFLKDEIIKMLSYKPDSKESYLLMAESNRISKELTNNQAEIHAQFSLNLSPCSCDCLFCSFAMINKVFTKSTEISIEEAVEKAKIFENNGANAIFIMTTANYNFDKFIEISKEIKSNLKNETKLIANIGDRNKAEADRIKSAGYTGVYHALRLREGIYTKLNPEIRKKSIEIFKEAGLNVGTCIEPVGPENTNEEIADMILYTASINPAYSGAARRITIPGSKLEKYGMISELRMAQIVAVTRLVMPRTTLGNCTHEPCTLGAFAGANLFWAEKGANPRDINENTEKGRGNDIKHCKNLFAEAGWNILKGPSSFYSN